MAMSGNEMTEEAVAERRAKMEARMKSGEPFTFAQIHWTCGDTKSPAYREADRLIQRWRRAGWIEFKREGRQTIWSLTKRGREMASV